MKRNLLSLGAVVIAIALSSFSTKAIDYYFVYNGGANQSLKSSYNPPIPNTAPARVGGSGLLNWIKVTDIPEDGITDTEFANAVQALDQTSGSQLNNESDGANIDVKNP